jgi:hypothetical protein
MAQKKVWVSWIAGPETKANPATVIQALQKNGMLGAGSPWINNNAKLAWAEVLTIVSDASQSDAWVIAAAAASLKTKDIRYALSLVAETARQRRGAGYPIVMLGIDELPQTDQLPLLLRECVVYRASDTAWAAKLVAAFFKKGATRGQDFFFAAHGAEYLGQWIEIGPRQGSWNGAMFGVAEGAKITHHAVGPRGALPERTVVEYPLRDMKVAVGGAEYTAWAVKNQVGADQSYFVKIEGSPASVICGAHPENPDAEVSVVGLV